MVGLGAHDHLENSHGRRVRMNSGDVVAGAFGNRYATDYYEWHLPTGTMAHLLTASSLASREAAATVLEVFSPAELIAGGAPELLSSAVGPA
jgi:hypothetical protein